MRLTSIALLSLLLGCAHHHHTTTTTTSPTITYTSQKFHALPRFTRVVINGDIDVDIHTGAGKSGVTFYGTSHDLADVKISQTDSIIYLSLDNKRAHQGRVKVDIRTQYLINFRYKGAGVIRAQNIQTRLLDLCIDNKGKAMFSGNIGLRTLTLQGPSYTQIQGIHGQQTTMNIGGKATVRLAGMVNVTHLTLKDSSALSMYWVDSQDLIVRMKDKTVMQLGGVVDHLDADIYNHARFNGRYLRSQRAFVKTHDNAVAAITVTKRQHTLATDNSNIYFYNMPTMEADFMALNGSVLDMRDWNMPIFYDHGRYND